MKLLKIAKSLKREVVLQWVLALLLATIVGLTIHPHGGLQSVILGGLVYFVAFGCQGRAIVRLLVKGSRGQRSTEAAQ